MARQSTAAQQLMQLMGVGETTATTVVAMVGNASAFDCGRQFAAWLGLTPGQYSSGGKPRLERITKAGDPYLRGLLVMGARAVLNAARTKSDSLSLWAVKVAGAAACAAQGLEAGAQLRLPALQQRGGGAIAAGAASATYKTAERGRSHAHPPGLALCLRPADGGAAAAHAG